jgi:uroporphyrinogen decarboxylase
MRQTPVITVPPYETMSPGAKKMRDFYALKPDAPIYQREFGFYSLDRWKAEGHIKDGDDLGALFGYDPPGVYSLGNLGWCEAGFCPVFEEKILEDQGDYELVQDFAGRGVRCFKGRRSGFMPEYVDHPVKDQKTWEEKCLWRMDPGTPERQEGIQKAIAEAKAAAAEGQLICANLVGGYMYIRSLMGPAEVMYLLYDNPELVLRCMEAWFNLADTVYAQIQKEVVFDELFIGEDICYNHGPLISIDMMKEFLFPYYRQLIANIKSRQLDKSRVLHFQVDTDGFSDPIIPHYRELGMDYLSPFEAASGCDVVRTAREYPDLLIYGGFDKRIMAKGKDAIDREVDRIMPVMKKRGGYIPTCDHGVPEEVSFENYLHYRKRMLEYAT